MVVPLVAIAVAAVAAGVVVASARTIVDDVASILTVLDVNDTDRLSQQPTRRTSYSKDANNYDAQAGWRMDCGADNCRQTWRLVDDETIVRTSTTAMKKVILVLIEENFSGPQDVAVDSFVEWPSSRQALLL